MIFAGIDVGSMSAEAVLMEDDSLLAKSIIVVEPNPVRSADRVMKTVLAETGLSLEDIAFCVSTGYGREKIPFAKHNVSEISCHGKGAFWANNRIRTIIDVGGQDCKVITVDDQGELVDFIMNDKCAAGTGRFLEGIARVFGIHVSELGPMALKGTVPAPISSICTVFTQFDVMGFLAEGKSKEDVALGVSEALATRVNRLVARLSAKSEICITGGVAKNNSVVKSLEKVMGVQISLLTVDPQIVGALGAAVLARNRYLKLNSGTAKNAGSM
jgi:(R)-2-hydroxyacyl-CoA dehydratese activating ATPase